MAIDVLAALGLAGNIVQFVEFLSKLLSESRALYNSPTGVADEHVVLEKVARDLTALTEKLTISSAGSPSVVHEFEEITGTCQDVAKKLSRSSQESSSQWPSSTLEQFCASFKKNLGPGKGFAAHKTARVASKSAAYASTGRDEVTSGVSTSQDETSSSETSQARVLAPLVLS